jgi:hypothetical protein
MTLKPFISCFAVLAFLTDAALAQVVKLPPIFRDHMVLQRDVSVPVWGQADAGSEVTVRFAGQSKTAIVDKQGRWEVRLDPISANNEPREMRIGNSVLRDVLVGEVWLCSGQSNMRWVVGPVGKFPGVDRLVLNFEADGTDLAVKGDRWNDIELAGEDGIYHSAQATLTGNAGTISTAAVKTPRAVRYGWRPVFEPTLFNAAGLPAAPFALWMDNTGNVRPGILTEAASSETSNRSKP